IKELEPLVATSDSDALYATGQALEASGKSAEAVKLYNRIYYELPSSTASVQAEARLAALGVTPKTSPHPYEEELSRCERLFAAKQYDGASAAYASLLTAFPDRAMSDETALHYGISLLNNRQPAQAANVLTNISNRNPKVHPEALD